MRNEDFIYRNGDNWIDLSGLPRKMYKSGREVIDWVKVNNEVLITFNNETYNINVKHYDKKHSKNRVRLLYNGEEMIIEIAKFLKMKFYKLFYKPKFFYEIGQIINDSVIIIDKHFIKHGQSRSRAKYYTVQCIRTKQTYKIREYELRNGNKSRYTHGKEKWAVLSLFDRKDLHPILLNIEESKTISQKSSKKVLTKCPVCNEKSEKVVSKLTSSRYYCKNGCYGRTSYGENFVSILLKDIGLSFKREFIFKELPNRRFDFYIPQENICIEVHGRQHYKDVNSKKWQNAHENSVRSDTQKREFCIKNNIELIEFDFSNGDFTGCEKEIKSFQNHFNNNTPIKNIASKTVLFKDEYQQIVELYKDGLSVKEISENLKISNSNVRLILKKRGVYNKNRDNYKKAHNKKVVCINNKKYYKSIKFAAKSFNIKSSTSISRSIRGYQKSAGKHPITGEPLKWMYLEDYIKEYGDEDLIYYEEKISS